MRTEWDKGHGLTLLRGPTGSGKTSLATHFALEGLRRGRYCDKHTTICQWSVVSDHPTPVEQGWAKPVEYLFDLDHEEHLIWLCDEAWLTADSRAWNSKDNKKAVYLATLARKYPLAIYATAPMIHMLDTRWRDIAQWAASCWQPSPGTTKALRWRISDPSRPPWLQLSVPRILTYDTRHTWDKFDSWHRPQ